MLRTCNKITATPRESLSTPTTPVNKRSPRRQTSGALLSLPESPRNIAIEMNQNETDEGAQTEDGNADNESAFKDGRMDAVKSSLD